jgi:hypothetical protein
VAKTLVELGLSAHQAIEKFAKAMEAEYPIGKEVQFKFTHLPVLSGTVSKHQYPAADAILGGLIVDVDEAVFAQCPVWAINKRYQHVTVRWSHLYFATQELSKR